MQVAKRIAACLLAVAMIFVLASCGGKKEVDLDALAGELTASSAFTVDMSQKKMADSVIPQTYFYEASEVARAAMYFNGDTVEEILLVQASDSKAADHLEELCRTRVDNEIEWMKSYSPEAVQRLENAILVKSDRYVVMVVANDAAAAKGIVDGYFK